MRSIFTTAFILLRILGPAQTLELDLHAAATAHGAIGMSVVSMCDGVITNSVNIGKSDVTRNIDVDDSTQYRIASISKMVTAVGLMRLYDQGLFALDDDVNGALGFTFRNPAFPGVPITYRMLLSHRSSLQDGTGYSPFLSATYSTTPPPPVSQLVLTGGAYYTADMWRTESPGSYFIYSNLNFGVVGTLIEALSGQRFDVYMREHILAPLGITGSFNVQDLTDLDHLAVLYRNSVAQADNLGGVMPAPPDLSTYTIGTNGLFFGPQGGLRVSARQLARVIMLLQGQGTWNGITLLQPATVQLMLDDQWTYNGSNGDDYYGLFRSWGLGVHRANAEPGHDLVFPSVPMRGHPGEAYGLISDAYFDPASGFGLVFITNGYTPGNAYAFGTNSAFYTTEEAVFTALHQYTFPTCALNSAVAGIESSAPLTVIGASVFWNGSTPLSLVVYDGLGRLVATPTLIPGATWSASQPGPLFVHVANDPAGKTVIIP